MDDDRLFAAFKAGYEAGFASSSERHNGEFNAGEEDDTQARVDFDRWLADQSGVPGVDYDEARRLVDAAWGNESGTRESGEAIEALYALFFGKQAA